MVIRYAVEVTRVEQGTTYATGYVSVRKTDSVYADAVTEGTAVADDIAVPLYEPAWPIVAAVIMTRRNKEIQ